MWKILFKEAVGVPIFSLIWENLTLASSDFWYPGQGMSAASKMIHTRYVEHVDQYIAMVHCTIFNRYVKQHLALHRSGLYGGNVATPLSGR